MEFFREVTPLRNQDLCVVLDSVNNGFDYPVHNHPEYEINLVMGTSGTRIVGDSTELYKDLDLVLIGPYLPHKWDESEEAIHQKRKYRVITVQFDIHLFSMRFFSKECFFEIQTLLENSKRGILFDDNTAEKAVPLMINLTQSHGFKNVMHFLELLNLLAGSKNFTLLSTALNSRKQGVTENYRIQKAYNYIMMNYTRPDFKISEIASSLNMSNSAFSHFFKKHAFRSFSSFLIDLRLSDACKMLLSSDFTMSQISVKAGFNNISNFNRLFKKYKECTPKAFKARYIENSRFDWEDQKTPWQFIPGDKRDSMIMPHDYSTRLTHI
ncbi:AraC family transcriptional regulator [Portibacter marinus]|uniref:AraC family transcriptional regulator n=1 Tax=Portibacter marinus TaxID=2898660 RepID=UPI001F359E59|nr:AraC family transcriptional regulator [Portibacter marinus]